MTKFYQDRFEEEYGACGVGFVAARHGRAKHTYLQQALRALCGVEHRGACGADGITGDGAGVMTDIPFELLGYPRGEIAVSTLFISGNDAVREKVLAISAQTFKFFGMDFLKVREVPTCTDVLGPQARESLPQILQVVISKPGPSRTAEAFNRLLYLAKQANRTKLRSAGCADTLHVASHSTTTVVYKALTRSEDLQRFYPDLRDPKYTTRFALFHRRFSTNTWTSWSKAQPLRLIAHNGEINTITSNRAWSYSREQAMGLSPDELLTHTNVSDSGSLNEMVEALKYRSSMPHTEDILAIMMPPGIKRSSYYEFWGRAVQPWDGPAFVSYADGKSVGARLDRNGFRPCRWETTSEAFYLASEAGLFGVPPEEVTAKGSLRAGAGVKLELKTGELHFRDPSESRENKNASFESRLYPLPHTEAPNEPERLARAKIFGLGREELEHVLLPMMVEGKEAIGSMGDTARMAIFSDEVRSFYSYFFQKFAQVTNPPLDYIRERAVTDLCVYLGHRPNIFSPKELLPPKPAIRLDSPILTLSQMQAVRHLGELSPTDSPIIPIELDCTFVRGDGEVGLRSALRRLSELGLEAVKDGAQILILSDRHASTTRPPVPSLLALRAVISELNQWGRRLECAIVVEACDIRGPHEAACALSFGATAVCPILSLELARFSDDKKISRALLNVDLDERERRVQEALGLGLLKIMSKMGISVVRSYQGSELFVPVGLHQELIDVYFPHHPSALGGVDLKRLASNIDEQLNAASASDEKLLPNGHQFREQPRGRGGEKHSMTAARSRLVHKMLRSKETDLLFDDYLELGRQAEPVSPRHLLEFSSASKSISVDEVEGIDTILKTFGSGAMSFGAISAESQRDLFLAMKLIGGRSNSGEGGENPYYFIDGTCASTKQIASGRFGVNAEYLVTGDEVEIKIAQGAKPGEGGQLMGVKVDEAIARARHATVGRTLISPPPLHDLYSIEDLKGLIYTLKQLKPSLKVCVKLVAGHNIGTIALGVVKTGADIIQISGGDGGTGAAPLSSMKHAGLPWELGLCEVQRTLSRYGIRDRVVLRVDGGLSTGKDIVSAAMLGAEEFGFGKLVLIAQGCIMARICQSNRCPAGIATHDPKFKAKYKGKVSEVVAWMKLMANDVRKELATIGLRSLKEALGRSDLLRASSVHQTLIQERRINLKSLLAQKKDDWESEHFEAPTFELSELNAQIEKDLNLDGGTQVLKYSISSVDRAVPARLAGILGERLARRRVEQRKVQSQRTSQTPLEQAEGGLQLQFTGSAGQGFCAFLGAGVDILLEGEANDSVCKSMSGGRVVIKPQPTSNFVAEHNAIIGNTALYGATGGWLFVHGEAGDRFAVRNSGANAVVEAVGLHACEYMTGGVVAILGNAGPNVGAGMTGGKLFLRSAHQGMINGEYLQSAPIEGPSEVEFRNLLKAHLLACQSHSAQGMLENWAQTRLHFRVFFPL